MDAERAALIRKYREGPSRIAEAVRGLSDVQLDYKPSDGGWSAREVVHHTADSEMTSAIRLRRLLAEDHPAIIGYDGDEFARRLFYAERPVQPSLDAIRAARETSASLLERLGEDDWRRTGTHSESGPYSIDTWLSIYAVHCHEHAEQIARAVAEAREATSS
jgi:DinB superfamily